MSQLALSSLDSSLIEEISSKRNEPNWLKEYRKNSLSVYHDLPAEVSPLYNKYTDARRMNPEQVSLSISSDSSVPDFLAKRLDEIKNEISIVQIGSNIYSINVNDELKSKGLVISSLDDALQNHSELIQKTLEDSNSKEDKYTALNNAAFNSGIFVHVPQNLIIDKPIHLVSCLSLDGISTISRNMIIAEKNTQVSVVQELYAPKVSKQQAYLELLDTRVGENSKLDFTTLQIMDQSTVNFSTRRTHLAQDAKINWYLGLFGSMLSRYRLDYDLNGTGAAVNDAQVVFGNNDQSFDLNTIVNHNAQSTDGKIVEISILKDT